MKKDSLLNFSLFLLSSPALDQPRPIFLFFYTWILALGRWRPSGPLSPSLLLYTHAAQLVSLGPAAPPYLAAQVEPSVARSTLRSLSLTACLGPLVSCMVPHLLSLLPL